MGDLGSLKPDIPDVLYDDTYLGAPLATTTGGTIDTFGSWIQQSANIGIGKKLVGILWKTPTTVATTDMVTIEIGEGAAASEVAVARVFFSGSDTNMVGFIPLNRTLTDNARITARAKTGTINSQVKTTLMVADA